jgi:hypothetical protein
MNIVSPESSNATIPPPKVNPAARRPSSKTRIPQMKEQLAISG